MRLGRAAALAAAIAIVSPASASAQEDFARNGFFMGLTGSYAVDTFEDDVSAGLTALGGVEASNVDGSLGLSIRMGYRFHANVSAEFQAEWLDGFKGDIIQTLPPVGEVGSIDVEPWVITGNAKGHLLTGRWQPFLLAGVGLMTSRVELRDRLGLGFGRSDWRNAFAARFGGGIDLYTNENIVLSVGADYVLPTGDLKDFDFVTIGWGFLYRF